MLGLSLLLSSVALVDSAATQSEPQLISEHKDWTVYVLGEGAEKICYMFSSPFESDPQVEGREAVWVTVTHRPATQTVSEVGVIAGYEYRSGTSVDVLVDTKKYQLFTKGDGAWLGTLEEESEIISDMKKGRRMSVVGVSTSGETTTDKFSLLGFTAAHRAIDKACS